MPYKRKTRRTRASKSKPKASELRTMASESNAMESELETRASELNVEKDKESSQNETPAIYDSEATEDASETDMVMQEEEYAEIKEKIHNDKLADAIHELELHHKKIHPVYLEGVAKIEKEEEDRKFISVITRNREVERLKAEHEESERIIREEYRAAVEHLRNRQIAALEEEKRALPSEVYSMTLTGGTSAPKQKKPEKPAYRRKLRPRGKDSTPVVDTKKKASRMQLNYLLSEEDIAEDLARMNVGEEQASGYSGMQTGSDVAEENEECIDVKIQNGKLKYNKIWWYRGQTVVVKGKNDKSEFAAQILHIGADHIRVKKLPDVEMKIPISELRKGYFTLSRRK